MVKAFGEAMKRTGDPLDDRTLYGPLHNQRAVAGYLAAIERVKQSGGKVEFGGKVRRPPIFSTGKGMLS